MTTKVALFAGDGTLDLTLQMPRVPEPDEKIHVNAASEAAGGVAANAAVACAMAGQAARLLIQAGADEAGGRMLAEIAARGVDVSAATWAGETCRVVILIEPHGEKRLLLYPGSSLYPSLSQAEAVVLDDVGWMHTVIYDPAVAAVLIARCRVAGIPWSIDLEPATFADGIEKLAPHLAGAAVVFCNGRAVAALGPKAVSTLHGLGARAVILTEGPAGATWCEGVEATHLGAPAVIPVDTTGAGDCLAGWLVAGLMKGLSKGEALGDAVLAASFSCTKAGAQLSYPSLSDLNRYKLSSGTRREVPS
jgi:ribokinase